MVVFPKIIPRQPKTKEKNATRNMPVRRVPTVPPPRIHGRVAMAEDPRAASGGLGDASALLPQLRDSLPVALDVAVVTDRTLTIRASVRDVQIELTFAGVAGAQGAREILGTDGAVLDRTFSHRVNLRNRTP